MFPDELLAYPQWVCWKYALTDQGKPTKVPYSARTGHKASVADPSSWADYQTTVNIAIQYSFDGIGFVLSETDPYTIVDLDDPENDIGIANRHRMIHDALDSYSEVSPSGKGLHIIVRGKVPEGRRRDKVEVYSSLRYFTMTGNTFAIKPIADRNYLVNQLWAELIDPNKVAESEIVVNDQPEKYTDKQIYEFACMAQNGTKFLDLWEGRWQTYYPPPQKSQSEGDFALINIIAFYSRNVEQIRRMFLMSMLGQRDKAKKRKNYVDSMIKRSYDNLAPEISIDRIKEQIELVVQTRQLEVELSTNINPFNGPLFENVPDPTYDWTKPPGLLGEIANYIYTSAPRPVKEIALAGAIGLMSGICGRAYNVSNTGVNQYTLVLAKTGIGKEAAESGINRLMQHVRIKCPPALDFLGPSTIASGQALIKHLGRNPCFVSIVGEFGLALQQMCGQFASSPQVALRRTLLDLYAKSGQGDVMGTMIYSDKDKNTEPVKSPAFSIFGESTPQTFYASLDETIISQGLMPRFTCIEYRGNRPPLNEEHAKIAPSEELINKLAELCTKCVVVAQHNQVIHVTLDAEADHFQRTFGCLCDGRINASEFEVELQLWNRAHLKMLKLAALIAIGLNQYNPTINIECIQWAKNLVERDVLNILKQFELGKAGKESSEVNQVNEVSRIIRDYIHRPFIGLEKYMVTPAMHNDKVVQHTYLQRRLASNPAFKSDRMGATFALKRTVDMLIADGALRQLKDIECYNRYGSTAKTYVVADLTRF